MAARLTPRIAATSVIRGASGATMAEIEIPWIIAGPGVAAGRELKKPVNTYDTALTVAHIFGLKPPDCAAYFKSEQFNYIVRNICFYKF